MNDSERTASENAADAAGQAMPGPEATADGGHAGIGARLKAAREAQGLSLDQVSQETKVPRRHLEAIEAGDFAALPARTYAMGFSRNFARVVGLDEGEVAQAVREETSEGEDDRIRRCEAKFEPGDPARVPSRGLVFLSIIALILLVAGGFTFYRTFFAPGTGPGSILTESERAAPRQVAAGPRQAAPATPAPTGPVVFTALMDDTWVKFYQADGTELMQKQMAKGESYTLPADATDPQVWTGRPYALAITVGGKEVPKLSEVDEIVKDVPVSAAALLARKNQTPVDDAGAAAPAATATAAPSQGAGTT